ncbi:MAG: NUDIX hydrolase [Dehalococcoidia bacterium]
MARDPLTPDDLQEQTLQSERLYEGRVVSLRRDTLRLADGHEAVREVVEHRPSVVVLALDEDGRIAFVRQWRTPAGGVLLELPAGVIEPDERPEAAAARELQEEVGLKPGALERVHGFYAAPGWATEYLHGFIARDCEPSPLPADSDERVVVEFYTLGEAMRLVADGEIKDAKSILMLQALALRAVGALGEKVIRFYRGD